DQQSGIYQNLLLLRQLIERRPQPRTSSSDDGAGATVNSIVPLLKTDMPAKEQKLAAKYPFVFYMIAVFHCQEFLAANNNPAIFSALQTVAFMEAKSQTAGESLGVIDSMHFNSAIRQLEEFKVGIVEGNQALERRIEEHLG